MNNILSNWERKCLFREVGDVPHCFWICTNSKGVKHAFVRQYDAVCGISCKEIDTLIQYEKYSNTCPEHTINGSSSILDVIECTKYKDFLKIPEVLPYIKEEVKEKCKKLHNIDPDYTWYDNVLRIFKSSEFTDSKGDILKTGDVVKFRTTPKKEATGVLLFNCLRGAFIVTLQELPGIYSGIVREEGSNELKNIVFDNNNAKCPIKKTSNTLTEEDILRNDLLRNFLLN